MDRKEIESLITKVIRQNDMRNRQGKNLQDVLMGILQYISDSGGGGSSDINLIPGGGIEITSTQNGIKISIDKTALTSIQYADTEVRRLEKDKVYLESPSGKEEMALVSQITEEVFKAYQSAGGTHNKGDFFTKLASLIDTDNPSE